MKLRWSQILKSLVEDQKMVMEVSDEDDDGAGDSKHRGRPVEY